MCAAALATTNSTCSLMSLLLALPLQVCPQIQKHHTAIVLQRQVSWPRVEQYKATGDGVEIENKYCLQHIRKAREPMEVWPWKDKEVVEFRLVRSAGCHRRARAARAPCQLPVLFGLLRDCARCLSTSCSRVVDRRFMRRTKAAAIDVGCLLSAVSPVTTFRDFRGA